MEILKEALRKNLGCKSIISSRELSGGSWNRFYQFETDLGSFFIKTAQEDWRQNFEAEAKSLRLIESSKTIRVPKPYAAGSIGNCSFLILENIDFGKPKENSQRHLGTLLAKMHSVHSPQFGFD